MLSEDLLRLEAAIRSPEDNYLKYHSPRCTHH